MSCIALIAASGSTTLSPASKRARIEIVRLGPSASNKQPWRVVKDGAAWHFTMQRTPGYPSTIATQLLHIADMQRLDMGITMCHFELMARELGLAGCWEVHDPGLPLPEPAECTVSWLA